MKDHAEMSKISLVVKIIAVDKGRLYVNTLHIYRNFNEQTDN